MSLMRSRGHTIFYVEQNLAIVRICFGFEQIEDATSSLTRYNRLRRCRL